MATAQLEHPLIQNGAPHPLHWSRASYYLVAETGCFQGKRVELIEGEIIEMSPMGSPHWVAVANVNQILQRAMSDDFLVIAQLPISLSDDTEPEPDVAVVAGRPDDYREGHPRTALLVVEVSDSSLQYDRNRKSRIYAAANVADYWIVDLNQGRVEVRRQPTATDSGHEYMELKVYSAADSVSPLIAPAVSIAVADLLPRKGK